MILRQICKAASLAALCFTRHGAATLDLDVTSEASIKSIASEVAFDMMTFYTANQTGQIPGKLPDTWWEGGALFMTLIQYWWFTGDTSYNEVTTQGMLWQVGDDFNYMPKNWSNYLGNDDQVFWGLAAMTAAELRFPDPPQGQPSWLGLAQAVLNTQDPRWDTTRCGGGLRWQIYPYQAGYTMKNAVSNGGYFQLAARLALYTGNVSYANIATRAWDWTASTPLLDNQTYHIADSTSMESNCTDKGDLQWTYNYAMYLMGAAYMYNFTTADIQQQWLTRVNGLLDAIGVFFPTKYGGTIMSEVACEPNMKCDRNQACFKGFLSSWMAFTTYLVPSTADRIRPLLATSATAASKQCTGGSNGRMCGLRWFQPYYDGSTNWLEQEMSVLSVVTMNLAGKTGGPPLTAKTGGTSISNPGLAGGGGNSAGAVVPLKPITTVDRAGAGIITAMVLVAIIGGTAWILKGS